MPVPPCPASHLVLIETYLIFGDLEALFNRPAPPGYFYQFLKLRVDWAKHHIVSQFLRLFDTAAHQQPVLPLWFLTRTQPQPSHPLKRYSCPVVHPRSFGAVSSTQPVPLRICDTCHHGSHSFLSYTTSNVAP